MRRSLSQKQKLCRTMPIHQIDEEPEPYQFNADNAPVKTQIDEEPDPHHFNADEVPVESQIDEEPEPHQFNANEAPVESQIVEELYQLNAGNVEPVPFQLIETQEPYQLNADDVPARPIDDQSVSSDEKALSEQELFEFVKMSKSITEYYVAVNSLIAEIRALGSRLTSSPSASAFGIMVHLQQLKQWRHDAGTFQRLLQRGEKRLQDLYNLLEERYAMLTDNGPRD